LRNNLMGVLVLGALFLSGQAYEWVTLFGEGVSLKDTFGTPFFTVTGIHGTHVFVGIIWGLLTLVSAVRGAYSQENHAGVEQFGLYWHFVDIVWIILFTIIYLF
jgi:heme/copper-type cytochrome/quinol oxidase subunit 3